MPSFMRYISLSVLMLLAGGLYGCAGGAPKPQTAAEAEAADARTDMEKAYGIKIDSIRLSAANYMMNFKFTVLDTDKVMPLMDHKLDPYVVQEKTGSKFAVPFSPKIGALRSAPKFPKAGGNYYFIFGNPGGYVKAGDLVTIIIGDFKAEHLTVM